MLIQTQQRAVTSSGVLETSRATIKATAKVFDFFATQTYSNKYVAICRELVANGIDSHRSAGKASEPVQVWLPTDFYPSFRVKDTGIGMSHEFVMNEFMSYTDGSTKDGDNLSIGGFGIGSKSPFAYVDQFTLRSVHNGTLSIYSVFKDTDGVPSVSLLSQSPTDEINGVEFSFPVEAEDFYKFADAVQKGLQYFDPLPLVYGLPEGAMLAPAQFMQEGKGWGLKSGNGAFGVVMGGVRYPVTVSELPYDLRHDDQIGTLTGLSLDLYLPIGACSITLSRETLLYDKMTTDAIEAALRNIVEDITRDIPFMFDKLPSRWEASKALAIECGMANGGSMYNARSKLVLAHAAYQGKPLDLRVEANLGSGTENWYIGARRHSGRRHRTFETTQCSSPSWSSQLNVQPYQVGTLIFDDLPQSPASATIKRIKTLVDESIDADEHVLVVRPFSPEILEALGNPQDYIMTSSLPAPVRAKRESFGGGMVRPRVRMFQLNDHGLHKAEYRAGPTQYSSPVDEIEYANQPDHGVLVTMENFELPAGFWKKMKTGLIDHDEIFLVNTGDAAKLKNQAGLFSFEEEFQQRLAAKLIENPTWEKQMWLRGSGDLFDIITFVNYNPNLLADYTTQNSPFAKIVNLARDYFSNPIPGSFYPFIQPQPIPRLVPDNLVEAFRTKNWKLDALIDGDWNSTIRIQSKKFNLYKDVI